QDRSVGPERTGFSRRARRVRIVRQIHLAVHRRKDPAEAGWSDPRTDRRQNTGVRSYVEGTRPARLQIRRLDYLLRVHAGHWHGRRPRRRLLEIQKALTATKSRDGF